jgi:hypothetical protein
MLALNDAPLAARLVEYRKQQAVKIAETVLPELA